MMTCKTISPSFTNPDSPSLGRYFKDIYKFETLKKEEEVALISRIRQGDGLALDRLIKSNLRFVVSIAKQYQMGEMPLGDLINEGNLGLIRAARRFDETQGFKFLSYAVWWIRQSILQALIQHSRMVYMPGSQLAILGRIKKASLKMEQYLEREPTLHEIAEYLEIPAEKVMWCVRHHRSHVSLYSTTAAAPDRQNTLLDVIPNADPDTDNTLMNDSLIYDTERYIARLTEREKEVIRLFYGLGNNDPLSLEDISERVGLCRERVRQIREAALKRIRNNSII